MFPRFLQRGRPLILIGLTLFICVTLYNVPQEQPAIHASIDKSLLNKIKSLSLKKREDDDHNINIQGSFSKTFKVQGHLYDNKGVNKEFEHELTSSVLHSFSPYTENRFREIILDPRNEQRVYANSPAMMWYKGEILVVMRIWLEKEKYQENAAKKPMNDFNDNYLYTQRFDRQMKPTSPGHVLGIPAPRQWIVGDGPIEPRLFGVKDNVFMSYNTGVFREDGLGIDSTFIWDYLRHKTIFPSIKEGSPMVRNVQAGRMPRDKHWTPWMDNNVLHMSYNLDPLRILKCTDNFSCHFSHFEGPDDFKFEQNTHCLRGGSPWVEYDYPYFLSVGHTTLFKNPSDDRVYTVNILLMKVGSSPRVVYTSGPLQVHEKPLDMPIVRFLYIQDPFFFPVSMIMENRDTIAIGGHVNDYGSLLLRVKGIEKILTDVIAIDKLQPADMKGPPIGTTHNSSRVFAQRVYKYKFYNH